MLGVPVRASAAVVRCAYHRMALRLHPDKPGGDARAFQRVRQAYDAFLERASVGSAATPPPSPPSPPSPVMRQVLRVMMLAMHQLLSMGRQRAAQSAEGVPSHAGVESVNDGAPPHGEQGWVAPVGRATCGSPKGLTDDGEGGHDVRWLQVRLEDIYHARVLMVRPSELHVSLNEHSDPVHDAAAGAATSRERRLRIDLRNFTTEYVFPRAGIIVRVRVAPHAVFRLDDITMTDVHAEVKITPEEFYYGTCADIVCLDGITRRLAYAGGDVGARRVVCLRGLGIPAPSTEATAAYAQRTAGADNAARGDMYVFFVLHMPLLSPGMLADPYTRNALKHISAPDTADLPSPHSAQP